MEFNAGESYVFSCIRQRKSFDSFKGDEIEVAWVFEMWQIPLVCSEFVSRFQLATWFHFFYLQCLFTGRDACATLRQRPRSYVLMLIPLVSAAGLPLYEPPAR